VLIPSHVSEIVYQALQGRCSGTSEGSEGVGHILSSFLHTSGTQVQNSLWLFHMSDLCLFIILEASVAQVYPFSAFPYVYFVLVTSWVQTVNRHGTTASKWVSLHVTHDNAIMFIYYVFHCSVYPGIVMGTTVMDGFDYVY
jgi:hypothetical protein